MKNCFILYSLNIWTLPFLWLGKPLYQQIYYVRCTAFIKTHFSAFVLSSKAQQVCELDYFSNGEVKRAHENVIHTGSVFGDRNEYLRLALSTYGGSSRFGAIIDQIFMRGWTHHSYMSPFISQFLTEATASFESVTILVLRPLPSLGWPEPSDSLRYITFHRPAVAVISLVQRFLMLLVLLIFPAISSLLLVRKGFRIGSYSKTQPKSTLFVHRTPGHAFNKARHEYMFHADILRYRDCSHYLMVTSEEFSPTKREKIERNGGILVSNSKMRIPGKVAAKRLVVDYYTLFLAKALPLISSEDINRHTFIQLLEVLHHIPIAEIIFSTARPDIVVLETETAPFANVCAVEARKQGVISVSMLHGDAGQDKPSLSRANMQYEHFLTPGRRIDALAENNPGLDHISAVGNFEFDLLCAETPEVAEKILPVAVRDNRAQFRVIGCFLVPHTFQSNRVVMYSDNTYIDDDHGLKLFNSYMQPLFDWVRESEDVCLIFKAKGDSSYYTGDPWVAALIDGMPKDRFILHYDMHIGSIIDNCDICISTGGSSTIGCAMAKRKPVITLDPYFDAWAECYHPLMAARTGTELVDKTKILLEQGFPPEVYQRFLDDWYAEGQVDHKTPDRIKALLDNLSAN